MLDENQLRSDHSSCSVTSGGNNMDKRIWGVVLPLMIAMLVVWGCSSDDGDDGGPVDPGPGPVENVGSVSGVISSPSKSPVENATISVGSATTTSNQDGFFILAQVAEGERTVEVSMAGRMSTFRRVDVVEGQTTHLPDLVLGEVETATFEAANGGRLVTHGSLASVEFPANSLVTAGGATYTGTVTVDYTAVRPDYPEFYGMFPGDFEGVREDGSTVMFESFGFMSVNMYGANKAPLQLADGQTASMSMDIGPLNAAAAPATMPMWYFDEAQGKWIEDGEAVLNGTVYETDVTHFTTWNWDLPVEDICRIEGYVHDASGNPVVGARVLTKALDYAIRDEAFTNSAGFFSVRARKNSVTDVWATLGARISDVSRVNVGETCPVTLELPLVLTVPAFSISLTWGEYPEDLDSHLYIPMTWDDGEDPDYDWYHLYYSTDGDLSDYPYTELDYDDTSSYGPENIVGTRVYQGTYEYWVYDYDSSSTANLAASSAQVRLEVAGGTWIFDVADVPLENADSGGWWHVFDVDVNASGTPTVDPVMLFQPQRSHDGVTNNAKDAMKPKM
jgi:hypothetical protein